MTVESKFNKIIIKSYKDITYFRGLDTLRFIAAYLVLMHHSETLKMKNGMYSLNSLSLFCNGSNAVTFFFVLSGFLITYLLLKEKGQTNTLNVKKFYIKRILRIWPLYYLLVFIGTIILPVFVNILNIDYDIPYTLNQVWYYFIFFLPGMVTFFYGHHLLEPLWSIGVEEMFYLIWAPLFKYIKKNILELLISIIFIKILLSILDILVETPRIYSYIISTFNFESMAIGGLGAYFIYQNKRDISSFICYKKKVQLIVYGILFTFLIFNINIRNVYWRIIFDTPIISNLLINFMFLYLIIGVSLAQNSILKLENAFFSNLGRISYGIYMYHMIVISVVILFLKNITLIANPKLINLFFYILTTVLVLFISYLSRKYFENYFLERESSTQTHSLQ